jgi:hypothetical protein
VSNSRFSVARNSPPLSAYAEDFYLSAALDLSGVPTDHINRILRLNNVNGRVLDVSLVF